LGDGQCEWHDGSIEQSVSEIPHPRAC
jgi:hypothetical protein